MEAYIEGIGVLGPGISGWGAARAILRGTEVWQRERTRLPIPERLPPAERRRAGRIIKATLAVGEEALAQAGVDAAHITSVFSSSSGDGQSCHDICAALTSPGRLISPTAFHNSVHNVAAGYWGIATGSMMPSAVLCAFDASFAAGLLESLTKSVADHERVLFLSYDTDYPEPLHSARPVPDTFACAIVLAPTRGARTMARLSLSPHGFLADFPPTPVGHADLERLRTEIPAARCLPLLEILAHTPAGPSILHVEYLQHTIEITVDV